MRIALVSMFLLSTHHRLVQEAPYPLGPSMMDNVTIEQIERNKKQLILLILIGCSLILIDSPLVFLSSSEVMRVASFAAFKFEKNNSLLNEFVDSFGYD